MYRLVRPTKEKLVPQRLKDLSETDEENKGLVKIALQKRKAGVQAALPQREPRPSKQLLKSENLYFLLPFPDVLRPGTQNSTLILVRRNGQSPSLETRRTQPHLSQIVSLLTKLLSFLSGSVQIP